MLQDDSSKTCQEKGYQGFYAEQEKILKLPADQSKMPMGNLKGSGTPHVPPMKQTRSKPRTTFAKDYKKIE